MVFLALPVVIWYIRRDLETNVLGWCWNRGHGTLPAPRPAVLSSNDRMTPRLCTCRMLGRACGEHVTPCSAHLCGGQVQTAARICGNSAGKTGSCPPSPVLSEAKSHSHNMIRKPQPLKDGTEGAHCESLWLCALTPPRAFRATGWGRIWTPTRSFCGPRSASDRHRTARRWLPNTA
jgi:hypothetical protein